MSINDCGVIVGVFGTDYNNAFVYQNGRLRNLGTYKGNPLVAANSINDRGQIVALYQGAAGTRTVLFSGGGEIQEIDALGAARQTGTVINNHDEIIGTTAAALGPDSEQGFVYRGGRAQSLGFGFGPTGINNSGYVVGNIIDYLSGDSYSYLLTDPFAIGVGSQSLTGLLSSFGIWTTFGVVTGINDSGQIIGYGEGDSGWIGFILTPIRRCEWDRKR